LCNLLISTNSQLFYDGHSDEAIRISRLISDDRACPPSTRLAQLVAESLKTERETRERQEEIDKDQLGFLDLDFQTESISNAPPPAAYETVYVTAHKGPCRSGAFNSDGTLVATGSVDTSIKVLDVEKMIAKGTAMLDDNQPEGAMHPVIRTLYDHIDEVTCLAFHPNLDKQLLFSGSEDCSIKVFDFSKPSVKRAQKSINDVFPIRSIALHPCGDYIIVGTVHPTLRLYDVETSRCFVGSNPLDQHNLGITSVVYNQKGTLYATASEDGDIKIWDAVSSRVINRFTQAHDGSEVCSLAFSKNGKYLLSSGKESLVKLWELSMSRCLIAYTGAGTQGKQMNRLQASFSHTEDFVLFPDEKTTSLCSWDARNAERKQLLALGHNQPVRFLAHSPTTSSFLTCSDDFRARFWHKRTDQPPPVL
jgi:cleavage stimulation factor subunit 1